MDDDLGNLMDDNVEEHGELMSKSPANVADNSLNVYESTNIEVIHPNISENDSHSTDANAARVNNNGKVLSKSMGDFLKNGEKDDSTVVVDDTTVVVDDTTVVADNLGVSSSAPPLLTPEESIAHGFAGTEEANKQDNEPEESLIKITILEEGHLRLVDSSNQNVFFSSDELRRRNIDVNNLTDENIQEIIQIAMPSILTNKQNQEEPEIKKQRIDSALQQYQKQSSADSHSQQYYSQQQKVAVSTSSSVVPHASAAAYSAPRGVNNTQQQPLSGNFYYRSSHSATAVQTETAKEPLSDAGIGGLGHLMIGEDVEVRNAEGRVDTATVRYYRPGTGYKIQFADYHFEWISEASVLEMKHRMANANYRMSQGNCGGGGPPQTPMISTTDPHNIMPTKSNGGVVGYRRPISANYHPLSSYHHHQQSYVNSASTSSEHHHGGHHRPQPLYSASQQVRSHAPGSYNIQSGGSGGGGVSNESQPRLHQQPSSSSHGFIRGQGHRSSPSMSSSATTPQHHGDRSSPLVPGMKVTTASVSESDMGKKQLPSSDTAEIVQRGGPHGTIGHLPCSTSLSENGGGETRKKHQPPTTGAPMNFYCAVCDRHCTCGPISYIVVRIPACRACAASKIAVLDDEDDVALCYDGNDGGGVEPTESMGSSRGAVNDENNSDSFSSEKPTTVHGAEVKHQQRRGEDYVDENFLGVESAVMTSNKIGNDNNTEVLRRTAAACPGGGDLEEEDLEEEL